ncbi:MULTISPECIES: tail assembly protein [Comamonas]|uniref:Phage-related protein, tail component n=1 Tax=Comamonas testosteroni TaxID=285 RepID=A0A8B4S478_COMTE|nr:MULTISPECIES: tail assembly protein [Comamonas]EHN65118.1 phage HK022 GP20-like protein [Comamonas testosteroni ATCC 11996]QQN69475.1 tail assembly protein [Comamonas testosteroni]RDI10976.1 putative phage tail protein [Comamonas sp. AG1104]SUY77120.1 Phage-related protein, tail component [Comamonas testosteroni]
MSDQLRTIRLYGYLGAQFGRVHRLAVASCAEAVQALCVLLPGFERELMTSKDRGVGYACFLGRRNLADDQLFDLAGQEDIRIAPMVQGAKRGGLFTLVLGAALFFAAPYLVNPATAGLLGEGGAMVFGAGVGSMGKLLMLSGVTQLLSPQQKGLSTADGPDNGASYNFNGPVNTSAQGNPVPLLYGELIIGSAAISAGIFAEDQQ